MPLIDLKCNKCGYSSEELIKLGQKYPPCPKCGSELVQNYTGLKTPTFKKNCSGSCGSCGGCGIK